MKNGLYKFTDKTHVSFNSLEQELHRIKKNGFAYDDEEFQEGVFCIGFPILIIMVILMHQLVVHHQNLKLEIIKIILKKLEFLLPHLQTK